MKNQKKILIAPLDWGNGHVIRCIPIIKILQELGCLVYVACTSTGRKILEAETENVQFIDFPGYNIKYSSHAALFSLKIALQVPKILFKIVQEHVRLRQLVKTHGIDAVISDNRYGMWHSIIPSVFITHQLNIQVPYSKLLYIIINKLNRWFIRQYQICWVPDCLFDGKSKSMAGALSRNEGLSNVKYIGNLSRLQKVPNCKQLYDITVLLSGPEPQRSMLESYIMNTNFTNKKVCIIRGSEKKRSIHFNSDSLNIIDYCNAEELQYILNASKLIICRSGYTTIMDLFRLNKQAILIPTPGQTEQEYLADYLSTNYGFVKLDQKDINNLIPFTQQNMPELVEKITCGALFDDAPIREFIVSF